jgi:NAD(P)-dependent dehydrogenase (short-subunit alcohol dehydrogenase family)
MLDGKVAYITGAASGIGESTARRFASEGARIALVDLQAEDLERVRRDIETGGGEVIALTCDVRDAGSVQSTLSAAKDRWGRLDVVFANAGIAGVWAPIEELRPEEWDRTIETNLRGAFLTLHFAIPHLKARGGSVIITSSISGNRTYAQAGAAAYSTSKAAQVAFMKMAALELGRYNIRVNAVCPGTIPTHIGENMAVRRAEEVSLPEIHEGAGNPTLHGGIGEPLDVADACLFLASELSRHVSGVELYVDGGSSLLR